MEFMDFVDKTICEVRERIGGECRVSVRKITKNNGITLTGLMVSSPESNVSPVVYLDHFHQKVEDGSMTFGEAVSRIAECHEENRVREHYDVPDVTAYGDMKGRLGAKLVNTGKNTDFLASVPNRRFLDLSLVYVTDIRCLDKGYSTVTVSNWLMGQWGVTEQDLFEQAEANMEAAGSMEIMNMSEVLRGFAGEYEGENRMRCGVSCMYVVTGKNRMHGAAAMTNPEIMRKAAAIFGRDFMILPSSVHELILVPSFGEGDEALHLARMVREINATEVLADEVLSGHVYRYDFRTGTISIAA